MHFLFVDDDWTAMNSVFAAYCSGIPAETERKMTAEMSHSIQDLIHLNEIHLPDRPTNSWNTTAQIVAILFFG